MECLGELDKYCATVVEKDCSFCETDFHWCDMCGKQMCLVSDLGTSHDFPFVYCKSCGNKLDNKDPSMDLNLLRLLVRNEDHKKLLVDLGIEEFNRVL